MGDPIQPILARPSSNTTLLAKYCKDKVPKTCDHAILQNTSRPCSLVESFVSSGSSLTIEMRMVESTALRQVLIFIATFSKSFPSLFSFTVNTENECPAFYYGRIIQLSKKFYPETSKSEINVRIKVSFIFQFSQIH